MIDHEISITVLGVEGDVIKLGISAPKDVAIYRKELYESIQKANLEAIAKPGMETDLNELLRYRKKTE